MEENGPTEGERKDVIGGNTIASETKFINEQVEERTSMGKSNAERTSSPGAGGEKTGKIQRTPQITVRAMRTSVSNKEKEKRTN